jgi:hypothetical protein
MENTTSRTHFSQVKQLITWRSSAIQRIGVGLILLAVFLGIFYALQFSTPNLAGTDGYYHIKFADLMSSQGIKPEFPWLPLTILSPSEFYDHHFLFHALLIPFTSGDLILGAKWASIIFASLAFLSIWWLLHNQNIPYAFLWSLGLLAVSEVFLYRMSMPRVQSLSLAFLALGLNFLLLKKYKLLIPLSFFYVWLYDGYPLILVMSGLYVLAVWIIERKFSITPLIYAGAGVFLGLLINPYFPHNIIFSVRHLLPKLIEPTDVRVGNEWYPYSTGQLLANSPLALAAFLSGTLAIGLRGRRMDVRTGLAFFLAITFALMLFQSRRFIEYFPPFALIFAAFAWSPLLEYKNREETKESSSGGITRIPHLISYIQYPLKIWLPIAILSLTLMLGGWFSFGGAKTSLEKTKSYRKYAQASSWLASNTPQGTRIFQTDWDDFPRLFFYNTWNTYLIGLDPTYMQMKDGELFDLWVDISRGKTELPSGMISEFFASEYVLSDLAHDNFIDQAGEDPAFVEVYRDEEAIIFQIAAKE